MICDRCGGDFPVLNAIQKGNWYVKVCDDCKVDVLLCYLGGFDIVKIEDAKAVRESEKELSEILEKLKEECRNE